MVTLCPSGGFLPVPVAPVHTSNLTKWSSCSSGDSPASTSDWGTRNDATEVIHSRHTGTTGSSALSETIGLSGHSKGEEDEHESNEKAVHSWEVS